MLQRYLIILLTYLYSFIPLLNVSAQLIGFQNCGLNFKNKKTMENMHIIGWLMTTK